MLLCYCILGLLFIVAFIGGITTLIASVVYQDPRFSVAIDSITGLELPTPPYYSTDLALNPEFNLTLHVASKSLGRSACMEARTYVELSYRCTPLAASATTTERFCVRPRKARMEHVVARGVAVRLPGHVLDGLEIDVWSGMEAFDVTIRRSGYGDDYEDVRRASCGGRRVGNAAYDLRNTCNAGHSCPDQDRGRTVITGKH